MNNINFNEKNWIVKEKNRIAYLLRKSTKIKKRYFKSNKKVFKFMNKHLEFKIEYIYMTAKNIVVCYSKRKHNYKSFENSKINHGIKGKNIKIEPFENDTKCYKKLIKK